MTIRLSVLCTMLLTWLWTVFLVQIVSADSSSSSTPAATPSLIPSPPPQITFPSCGTNTIISGIAGSGCGFTDAGCLCKAKSFLNAAQNRLTKACPNAADAQVYINFINAQCSGQPGYPISLSKASFASLRLSPGTWSALAAAVLALIGL